MLALIFRATALLPEKAQAGVVIWLDTSHLRSVLGTPGAFAAFRGTSEQGELQGLNISLARELARSI